MKNMSLKCTDGWQMKEKAWTLCGLADMDWGSAPFSTVWCRKSNSEGEVSANQHHFVLSDHLYSDVTFLFWFLSRSSQDDNEPTHDAQRVMKWFDEYKNDLNNMLWVLQWPDLNPTEPDGRLWTDSVLYNHRRNTKKRGDIFWKNDV